MREVRADYNDLSHRPALGLDGETLPLGTEDIFPELANLQDGETLLVIEPGEVVGEGEAVHRDANGKRYWYAQRLHNIRALAK